MPHEPEDGAGEEAVEERATDLLPEERHAGVDDPRAAAAAVLADSEERREGREESGDTVEHRRSGAP